MREIQASPVIAALEAAWDAIRARHPEVEPCLLITGQGKDKRGRGVTLGHYRPEAWKKREGDDHLPEVLISGERMDGGAKAVMQTLLHEAVHSLAHVREVKDTSRGHRYHNKRFVALAEELGMAPPEEPSVVRGWSAVRITDATAALYSDAIERIDRAIAATIPCGDLTDKDEEQPTRPTPSYDCACAPARKIRMARDTWEAGEISCGVCDCEFEEV